MKFTENKDGSITCVAETEGEKQIFKKESELWDETGCKCKEDYGVDFHDDNTPGALVMKHHYTCKKCKGLVQIG